MTSEYKVLVTTVPFAARDRAPLELLETNNIKYVINPLGQRLTEDQLCELVSDFDALIAGTEPITANVLKRASKLKHISRVGIGLDNVDLIAARERGIEVSYTPDAPAPAVAELTIGLMLSLLRSVHLSNSQMHLGNWHRFYGRRLSEVTVGVIGVGRIGSKVIEHLQCFGPPVILANDIQTDERAGALQVEWVEKDTIFKESDIVTLHLPLTRDTKNLVVEKQLLKMKEDASIINVSRGGIVNENDLHKVISSGHLRGAAIDTFEQEPYSGPLINLEKVMLTAHMGSMSIDCRDRMEIEATEEVVRFRNGETLKNTVPNFEFEARILDDE